MTSKAFIFWSLVAVVALSTAISVGQSLDRKRLPHVGAAAFAPAAVADPSSALPAGEYTVGASGAFPTIDSAFAKLSRDGVLGAVTLTLIDTLYVAPADRRFELGPVAGAGAAARITIRPAVGTMATIRGDSDEVLSFNGVKHLTLDGRSDPPSQSAGIAVHALYNLRSIWNVALAVWGDADSNEFLHLTITSDDPRGAFGSVGVGLVLGNIDANTPDDNLIEGNTVTGTQGIYVFGAQTARPRGNVIRGNTVGSAANLIGSWGIQSEFARQTVIEGNTVAYLVRAMLPDFIIGINSYCDVNTVIRNNVVHSISGSFSARVQGISGTGAQTAIGQGLRIYNNKVYDLQNSSTTGSGCIAAIRLWWNTNPLIAFNTVQLSGTGKNPLGTASLWLDGGISNATARNNILINTYNQEGTIHGPSTASVGLYIDGSATFTSDHNDLYADTLLANSFTLGHGADFYRTLFGAQRGGHDPSSVTVLPAFTGPYIHIADSNTTASPLDGMGVPIAGMGTDFDGAPRNATAPDIGADEFAVILGVAEERTGIPQRFALGQNYPNPFNPETRISYSLPRGGQVSLVVYDMLGRTVATLIQQTVTPGEHSLTWSAQGVPSGVYFYRMVAGDQVETRKLVIMR